MVHLEVHRVLDDFPQMLTLLHVVLAPVVVMAHMCNLLVLGRLVVLLPLGEVVHVLKVVVSYHIVGVLLGNLENDLVLLLQVLVIGEN